jgi:hypothetical protein
VFPNGGIEKLRELLRFVLGPTRLRFVLVGGPALETFTCNALRRRGIMQVL